MAHVIIEGWHVSQDLQWASLKPRRANGTVSGWPLAGLRHKKSWCFSSSPKARKDWCPRSRHGGRRRSTFLFYSVLQLIGWGLPTLGQTICFHLQSTDSNIHIIRKYSHTHTHTQNNAWQNVWGHLNVL